MPYQPVMGQIMPFAGAMIPRNWALCNGALLAIQTNQALFSLLGTYYGGDGVRTFALPDLRGRAILGSSGGSGQYPAGMISGSVSVNMTGLQLPQHNHMIQATAANGQGRGAAPTNNIFATTTAPADRYIFLAAGSAETPLAVGTNLVNEGGGQPHNNMQPYLVINYLIAMQGLYPSRN
ncbi:phage tail protein [Bradyrhizobium sp. cf659]|uniref:phage tail protein n=1 Tax=Bradyrhizobium sp. cf659 TaxID=1761771 RepID=UPI0008E274FA|nr:tail fiber protein [Bradyrhizobium sp. cf659]SFH79531.1 Microcystin-dependent protein [Bradyrhizobium sp. cf659]